MEQELRIARQIQMSLLPQATFSRPGLGLMAHCEPAREVGGDYYDFLSVGDAVGILIADVSGKGTSAALYMAELKGLVLALSQQHMSPRKMLIDANRIISQHLDSRSFITVSYVLVDMATRTLQYSRAGHCPMLYVPGPYAVSRTPQVLAPDGMVLGLTIDDGTMFNRLLEERSEEHTSELQSQSNLVCRLLLETKKASRASIDARTLKETTCEMPPYPAIGPATPPATTALSATATISAYAGSRTRCAYALSLVG